MQVILQVLALRANAIPANKLTGQYAGIFSLRAAIGISITIAVINTLKTVLILKLNSKKLDLTFSQYIWCAVKTLSLVHQPPNFSSFRSVCGAERLTQVIPSDMCLNVGI